MHWLNALGVITIALYAPLMLGFTGIADRLLMKRWAGNPGLRSRFYLLTSLGGLWILLGGVWGIITWQKQWPDYWEWLWAQQSFVWAMFVGLVGGPLLYFTTFRVYSPFVRRILGRYANWRAPQSDVGRLAVLRLYTSRTVIVAMLVSNAVEEFIWRGFLLFVLAQWTGNWIIPILVSGVLYGSYHYALGPHNAVLQGYNGGVYAVTMIFTKGLLAPWLMHVIYNLLAVWAIRHYLNQQPQAGQSTQLTL